MRAGRLDRRLTILRRTQTGVDSHGAPIVLEGEVMTVWAEKIHRSEDEAFAAEQRYARRMVTFRTRWTNDIQATDRLLCDGILYDVKGVREIGRRAGLEIAAETQE